MERYQERKNTIPFLAVLILLGAAIALSIVVGKYPISLAEMFDILLGNPVKDLTKDVFLTLRLPRTIMALVAGLALGIGGAVFQLVFKNPLASPDIVGVMYGANLGAAIAIVLFGGSMLAISGGAFFMALLAVSCVIAFSRIARRRGTITYVLGGIAINALCRSAIMALKYFADTEKELEAIEFWAMGTFKSITADKLMVVLPVFLVGFLGILFLRYKVTLLSLSDDEAHMLGVRVERTRYLVLGCATLMIAAVTAVTGQITFVGLVAPHLGRIILRRNDFSACVFSGLLGACLLLLADCLARSLAGGELPISILTSAIGVPFLVYFICRRKHRT